MSGLRSASLGQHLALLNPQPRCFPGQRKLAQREEAQGLGSGTGGGGNTENSRGKRIEAGGGA